MLYWFCKGERGYFVIWRGNTKKGKNLTLNLSNPKQPPPSPGIFFFPSAAGRETSWFSSTTAASPFPQAPFSPAKTREQKERRPSLSSRLPPFSGSPNQHHPHARPSSFSLLTHQHRSPLSSAASSSSVFSTAKGQVNSAFFSLGRLPTATEKQHPQTSWSLPSAAASPTDAGWSAFSLQQRLQICPLAAAPTRRRPQIQRHFQPRTSQPPLPPTWVKTVNAATTTDSSPNNRRPSKTEEEETKTICREEQI